MTTKLKAGQFNPPQARADVLSTLRFVKRIVEGAVSRWDHGGRVQDGVRRHSLTDEDRCLAGATCNNEQQVSGNGTFRQHFWARKREIHEYAENSPRQWQALADTCEWAITQLLELRKHAHSEATRINKLNATEVAKAVARTLKGES